MAGISTKDTSLSYKVGLGTYAELAGLLEVPELGGAPEKIDTTTLADAYRQNIPGIRDMGDLVFKFLYDNSGATANYRVLKGLQADESLATFKVEYPDGTAHEFDAYVTVSMDSAAVNGALTFSATLMLQSDLTITDPVV